MAVSPLLCIQQKNQWTGEDRGKDQHEESYNANLSIKVSKILFELWR